jgi:hypothetical protein
LHSHSIKRIVHTDCLATHTHAATTHATTAHATTTHATHTHATTTLAEAAAALAKSTTTLAEPTAAALTEATAAATLAEATAATALAEPTAAAALAEPTAATALAEPTALAEATSATHSPTTCRKWDLIKLRDLHARTIILCVLGCALNSPGTLLESTTSAYTCLAATRTASSIKIKILVSNLCLNCII